MEILEGTLEKPKGKTYKRLLVLSILLLIAVIFTGMVVYIQYLQKKADAAASLMAPKTEQNVQSNSDNNVVNPFPTKDDSYQNPFATDSSNTGNYTNPFQ